MDRVPEHGRRRRLADHVPRVLPVLPRALSGRGLPVAGRSGESPARHEQLLGLPAVGRVRPAHASGGRRRTARGRDLHGRLGRQQRLRLLHRVGSPGDLRRGLLRRSPEYGHRHDRFFQQPWSRHDRRERKGETRHRGAGNQRPLLRPRRRLRLDVGDLDGRPARGRRGRPPLVRTAGPRRADRPDRADPRRRGRPDRLFTVRHRLSPEQRLRVGPPRREGSGGPRARPADPLRPFPVVRGATGGDARDDHGGELRLGGRQ